MRNGKHGIPQPSLNLPRPSPSPSHPKRKFGSQPYIHCYRDIIITLSNKVVSNGPTRWRRRQEADEFFFGFFCPPFSELEVWQHESRWEWWMTATSPAWVPHALSVFYRLVHQFMGNRAWHCSSVLAQRDPGGGEGLHPGLLGSLQLLGKALESTTPKKFFKKS